MTDEFVAECPKCGMILEGELGDALERIDVLETENFKLKRKLARAELLRRLDNNILQALDRRL